MIRLSKNIEIFEWGSGTKQGTQNWSWIARGKITNKPKFNGGHANIIIDIEGGQFNKQNLNDESLKLCQVGEGMTSNADSKGEVAMGHISKVENNSGKCLLSVRLSAASKFSN